MQAPHELEIGEDFCEEEPGPEARVDEARVLANPAKARLFGKHPFLHRAVVHARKCFEPGPGRVSKPLDQRTEPGAEHAVIVVSPRVARDRGL